MTNAISVSAALRNNIVVHMEPGKWYSTQDIREFPGVKQVLKSCPAHATILYHALGDMEKCNHLVCQRIPDTSVFGPHKFRMEFRLPQPEDGLTPVAIRANAPRGSRKAKNAMQKANAIAEELRREREAREQAEGQVKCSAPASAAASDAFVAAHASVGAQSQLDVDIRVDPDRRGVTITLSGTRIHVGVA